MLLVIRGVWASINMTHCVSLRINRKSYYPKPSDSGFGFRKVYWIRKKWSKHFLIMAFFHKRVFVGKNVLFLDENCINILIFSQSAIFDPKNSTFFLQKLVSEKRPRSKNVWTTFFGFSILFWIQNHFRKVWDNDFCCWFSKSHSVMTIEYIIIFTEVRVKSECYYQNLTPTNNMLATYNRSVMCITHVSCV
jgi:hypothetical protein